MKTAKEILTENRESVISSIKWIFKVWKAEDIKVKMIEFLAYCEANMNVEEISKSKRVKTDLKNLVGRMSIEQDKKRNLEIYGTERPKLADIMGRIADREEEAGNVWNPLRKEWVKNENAFSSMSK
jgi:hypothetical protein